MGGQVYSVAPCTRHSYGLVCRAIENEDEGFEQARMRTPVLNMASSMWAGGFEQPSNSLKAGEHTDDQRFQLYIERDWAFLISGSKDRNSCLSFPMNSEIARLLVRVSIGTPSAKTCV